MVRLQILSDVHPEMRGVHAASFDFPVLAPVLALLGDIGDPGTDAYADFLKRQATRFERVLVLCGNHEAYGRTLEEAEHLIRDRCAGAPGVTFMHRRGVRELRRARDVDQMSDVRCFIADHRAIRGWSIQANQQRIALAEADEKTVIVLTHHAPTHQPPQERRQSAVKAMFRLPVLAWCHGHFSGYQRIRAIRTRMSANVGGCPRDASSTATICQCRGGVPGGPCNCIAGQ
jgi:hypothetical protein